MRKIHLIYRAIVIMARDMFIGFILGLCATVLLSKINPGTQRVSALLIPAGAAAGAFKGLSKFVMLNMFSVLPSKGYRFNYPKYKLLLLWIVVFLAVFTYVFGFNISLWFARPVALLKGNIILGSIGMPVWTIVFGVITGAGLLAHLYEPPYNEEEFLPPPPEDEDQE